MHKNNEAPVPIRRLNAAAEPLRFLDFLIEDPISAVMISGTPCLVRVSQPARYALHKLILEIFRLLGRHYRHVVVAGLKELSLERNRQELTYLNINRRNSQG